jgi:SAM-dependent methyltransferase
MAYGRLFARLYDTFYESKSYARETEFLDARLRSLGVPAGGQILDLACGTGGHALELASLGYRVRGVDRAEGMLAQARDKAVALGVPATFVRQDLRELDVGADRYHAATCLFDSIGYLLTDTAITDVFSRVRASLAPEGVFILEAWHGAAMLGQFDPLRVSRYEYEDRSIVRISETAIDVDSQAAVVAYTVFAQAADGRWDSFEETHTNRFFFRQDLSRLLESAGFTPCAWLSGFTDDPVTADTWHLLVVCRAMNEVSSPGTSDARSSHAGLRASSETAS